MKIELRIRENFNTDLGQTVFTVERTDGELLFPADAIQGLNYSTREKAEAQLEKVTRSVNNGGGQF